MNWNVRPRLALSGLICSFLALSAFAQEDAGLRLLAIQGSQAENVVSQPARPITVRVVDRSDRPVPGATVVFTAPRSGPGGDFVGGTESVIVFTNPQGIAKAPEFRANSKEGSYHIQIRAAYMSQIATISLLQRNVVSNRSRKVALIAALAGGAAAAAFLVKGSGGEQNPSRPTPVTGSLPTIVFTGASVGGPR